MKKVYLETYGCQMNEYDSELVRAILSEDQYLMVDQEQEADIVMLNTCSVRDNANRKVYARIHALRHGRAGRPVIIGVLGCMATNLRKTLLDDPALNLDLVVGPDSYRHLPALIRQIETTGQKAFNVTLSEFETYSDIYPNRAGGVNAWIAVMRGCNNFCSFCVVPYSRGQKRSRSPESVVAEVERLAQEGFRQVTLLGQNVNSYQYEGQNFANLLEKVSLVSGIERIRFTSPHPKDFPHPLMHVVAENPRVCKHIHLPLQAGNDRILELMNRTYTSRDFLQLVAELRTHYPALVLTTDIIVGFPTETEAEFADTIKIVREIEFDSAFIFKYSERQGTIASRKYPDSVGDAAKTDRIVRLNELQKEISLKKNRAHIGETQEVLIEAEATKKSNQDFQGRNDGNKLVIFPRGAYAKAQFVDVEIADATAHVLKGRVVRVNTR